MAITYFSPKGRADFIETDMPKMSLMAHIHIHFFKHFLYSSLSGSKLKR